MERLGVLGATMTANHPHEPHWYLNVVSTMPANQGQGLGTAVLQPVLARCDADGTRAYLESTNPRNHTLYHRHGFVDAGEIRRRGRPQPHPHVARAPLMEVLGLTFVGTFSPSRAEMAAFVRDVLGARPRDARGMDADVFALPDGTTSRSRVPTTASPVARSGSSSVTSTRRWPSCAPPASPPTTRCRATSGSATSTSGRPTASSTSSSSGVPDRLVANGFGSPAGPPLRWPAYGFAVAR